MIHHWLYFKLYLISFVHRGFQSYIVASGKLDLLSTFVLFYLFILRLILGGSGVYSIQLNFVIIYFYSPNQPSRAKLVIQMEYRLSFICT